MTEEITQQKGSDQKLAQDSKKSYMDSRWSALHLAGTFVELCGNKQKRKAFIFKDKNNIEKVKSLINSVNDLVDEEIQKHSADPDINKLSDDDHSLNTKKTNLTSNKGLKLISTELQKEIDRPGYRHKSSFLTMSKIDKIIESSLKGIDAITKEVFKAELEHTESVYKTRFDRMVRSYTGLYGVYNRGLKESEEYPATDSKEITTYKEAKQKDVQKQIDLRALQLSNQATEMAKAELNSLMKLHKISSKQLQIS